MSPELNRGMVAKGLLGLCAPFFTALPTEERWRLCLHPRSQQPGRQDKTKVKALKE